MPRKKPVTDPVTISLAFGSEHHKASGATIVQVLEKMDLNSKGKGVLTIQSGDRKAELMVYPFVLKKLANNRLSRELFQKRMSLMLK